jgi:hypothetical protein
MKFNMKETYMRRTTTTKAALAGLTMITEDRRYRILWRRDGKCVIHANA